jgi:hypothetical protein
MWRLGQKAPGGPKAASKNSRTLEKGVRNGRPKQHAWKGANFWVQSLERASAGTAEL